jgi:hypothetical protein
VNLQIGAYYPFMPSPTFGLSSYDNDKVQEYDYGLTPGVKSNPSHAREHCTDEKRYPHADIEEHNHIGVAWSRCSKEAIVRCIASGRPGTRCSSRMPLSFCPSNTNCHARIPVAITGAVEIAASSRLAAS